MRILIKGYFGFGNFGDDLLLKIVFSILRQQFPLAEISIFSNNTVNNSHFNLPPDFNHYIFRLLQDDEVKLVDWTYSGFFNLVVDGGGGIYFDYRNGGFLYGVLNRCTKIFSAKQLFLLDKVVRMMLRKEYRQSYDKRIAFGIGLERYHPNAPSMLRSKITIGSSDAIFVRDNDSLGVLLSMGYTGKALKFTDNVFIPNLWRGSIARPKRQLNGPLRVGVVLMNWSKLEGAQRHLIETIELMENRGYEVSLFSFDRVHDSAIFPLFEKIGRKIICWDPHHETIDSFGDKLAKLDLLISARAHGVIVGGILGIPAICLNTRDKLKSVHDMFTSSILQDVPFNPHELLKVVQGIENSYNTIAGRVEQDVVNNEEIALRGLREFLKML